MTDAPEDQYKQLNHLKMFIFAFASFLFFSQLAFGSDAHKKSLFLENITPFITWPQNNKSNFYICVLNDKAVLNALQSRYGGKNITKKPVLISNILNSDTVSQCDILFIGKKTESVIALTQALSDKPILTLSDTKVLIEQGIMITMHEDDDRINCTINHKAAQQADIHISYLLLESSYKVIN